MYKISRLRRFEINVNVVDAVQAEKHTQSSFLKIAQRSWPRYAASTPFEIIKYL